VSVQRYKVEELNCCFNPDMVPSDSGEYVLHDDYAALKAENERLRAAGDAVALDYAERIEIEAGEPADSLMRTLPVLKAWLAAKGVQP
jgi:hypothetical protein